MAHERAEHVRYRDRVVAGGEEARGHGPDHRVPRGRSSSGAAPGALRLGRRRRLPAHFTVVYPFRPVDALTAGDHERLADLFEAEPAFRVHGSRTAWFADQVLYVPPDDPEPILDLIAAVTAAFPDRPPYGGAHDTVVPHLTVGHDSPVAALQDAERDVLRALPFSEDVTTVALWRGPAPNSDGRSPARSPARGAGCAATRSAEVGGRSDDLVLARRDKAAQRLDDDAGGVGVHPVPGALDREEPGAREVRPHAVGVLALDVARSPPAIHSTGPW